MSVVNFLTYFPMRKSYYLKHPLKFIKQIHYNIKNSIERITKGYSYFDVMDMDDFLLALIPAMLHDLSHGGAYPGDNEFPTYESWSEWCNNLAIRFEEIQDADAWENKRNEYLQKWHTICKSTFSSNSNVTTTYDDDYVDEIKGKYFKRMVELTEERAKIIIELFTELSQKWDRLWI